MQFRTKSTFATVATAAAVVGAVAAPQAQAAAPNKAAGYAALIATPVLGSKTLAPAAYPSSRTWSVTAGGNTKRDLVVVDALDARTGGNKKANTSWATSTLGRAGINIKLPASKTALFSLRTDGITARCNATPKGATGSASFAGINLVLAGGKDQRLPVKFKANTRIQVPGLLDITFNKQVKKADGTLTVTAVSIKSTSLLDRLMLGKFEVSLAKASCGATAK